MGTQAPDLHLLGMTPLTRRHTRLGASHAHGYTEWAFVAEGAWHWQVPEQSLLIAGRQQLVMLPPHTMHRDEGEAVIGWLAVRMQAPARPVSVPLCPTLSALLERTFGFQSACRKAPRRSQPWLHLAMAAQLRAIAEASGLPASTHPALTALLADPDKPIRHLAKRHGISTRHLRRECQAAFGKSPRELRATRRLERALEMLRGSTLTIRHIAECTGFADAAHLTREVRRALGTTPSAYRRQTLCVADFPPCAVAERTAEC